VQLEEVEDSLEWKVDRTPKCMLYVTSHLEKHGVGCPPELCRVHFLGPINIRYLGARIFTSTYDPDRVLGSPNLLSNGYRG
jgi:hypothetical protein